MIGKAYQNPYSDGDDYGSPKSKIKIIPVQPKTDMEKMHEMIDNHNNFWKENSNLKYINKMESP